MRRISLITFFTVACTTTVEPTAIIEFADPAPRPLDYQAPPGALGMALSGPTQVAPGDPEVWTARAPELEVGDTVVLGWGGQQQPGHCPFRRLVGGHLCVDIAQPAGPLATTRAVQDPMDPAAAAAIFSLPVPATGRDRIFLQAISLKRLDSATTNVLEVIIEQPAPFPAPSADFDLSNADMVVRGEVVNDYVSDRVVVLDDLDGDGLEDFAITRAHPQQQGGGGQVHVFFSSSRSAWPGWDNPRSITGAADLILSSTHLAVGSTVGQGLARVGDLDGDGVDEIAVTDRNYPLPGIPEGAVHIIRAADLPMSGTVDVDTIAHWTIIAETSNSGLGFSMAPANFDGDALGDLVLGSQTGREGLPGRTGVVYAVTGAALAATSGEVLITALATEDFVHSTNSNEYFGSLVEAGDIDGDGLDELFAGAIFNSRGGAISGEVVVFDDVASGQSGRSDLDALTIVFGGGGIVGLGTTLSLLSDRDGDGLVELALTANASTDEAWILSSSTLSAGGLLTQQDADQIVTAGFNGLTELGDVSGDGISDIFAGGSWGDPGQQHLAFVIDGSALTMDGSTLGPADAVTTFESQASIEDVVTLDLDGDGFLDFVFGELSHNAVAARAGQCSVVTANTLAAP